jgi:branched-subunit amino acid aminotransferase/4-amino-4-deoxychorismate lyase
LAKKNHLPLQVRAFTAEELNQATSLFLTNSLMGIQPIHRIKNKDLFPDHPLILQLQQFYLDFCQKERRGVIVIKDEE